MTTRVSSCGPLVAMHNTPLQRTIPFPLPKKLGSDRLLLVSKALHEIPTYKSISPELQKQRKSLKPSNHDSTRNIQGRQRRVHFRAVDQFHEYEKDYDECDHSNMWFSAQDFELIFDRDDEDFSICFGSMSHTRQILQLWGMCSRGADSCATEMVVDTLFREVPQADLSRGLEHRIITGIRNHRQKAVQSFLQLQNEKKNSDCSRYLNFSQTAGRFAQALAEGDARIAQMIHNEPEEGTGSEEEDWGT